MHPVGWSIDRVIGHLSRGLHLRRAKLNTVSDLGPLPRPRPRVLFPAPVAPRTAARADRACPPGAGASSRFSAGSSQHVPLCPATRIATQASTRATRRPPPAGCTRAPGPRRRALVYVHGWLEPGPWPEQFFFLPHVSEALDVDVLHVQLPFHGDRNPRSSLFHGEFFWTGDLVRSIEAVRQSCIDTRSLVAWLRQQGYDEVGVTGFSMGARSRWSSRASTRRPTT